MPRIAEKDIDNESFKDNEDWWKDPFAMFGDDEGDRDEDKEEVPMSMNEPLGRREEMSAHDEFLIVDETKTETLPEPVVPTPPPAANKSIHEKDSKNVNPLVEAAMASQTASKFTMPSFPSVPTKLTAVWKALPLVNLLASFAFVKVVQPVISLASAAVADKNANDKNHHEYHEEDEDDEHEDLMDQRNDQDDDHVHVTQKVKRAGHSATSSSSPRLFSRMFAGPRGSNAKLPPARELMDLVEALQRELDICKMEKEAMEKEYEKASWQVRLAMCTC